MAHSADGIRWALADSWSTEAICDGATHWMFDPASGELELADVSGQGDISAVTIETDNRMLVADRMTVGIVDRLEMIDIEERETDADPMVAEQLWQALHELVKRATVPRTGEGVMMGHRPEFLALLFQGRVHVDETALVFVQRLAAGAGRWILSLSERFLRPAVSAAAQEQRCFYPRVGISRLEMLQT